MVLAEDEQSLREGTEAELAPPPPDPPPEASVLFDHENRLRAIEGEPPLTLVDFISKTTDAPAPTPTKKTRRK